ncbi:MAG: hypothetical protein DRJ42_06680 [Deltaproteobacteria bacterium]|nr:MAG: hypothetical protein DRJ42_06680 [Deltaproteobacteria bacterium]
MDDRTRIAELEQQLAMLQARVEHIQRTDATPFLASVLAAVPAFITRLDADLCIKYMNRVSPGVSKADLIGAQLLDFVAPEYVETARSCIEGVMETGRPDSYRADGIPMNGRVGHYDVQVTPVSEPDGSLGALLITTDITDSRLGAEELAHSRQRLQVVVGATRMGLWSLDMKTRAMRWDARTFEIFGVTTTPEWADYVTDAVHPDDQARIRREQEGWLQKSRFVSTPHRIVRPNGDVRWVQMTASNHFDEEGTLARVVGGHLDVTEQRGLEDELRETQRREAVGALAGGVAHRFNNLLTAIIPSLEFLRDVVDAEHVPVVDDATHAGHRAAKLVRSLAAYAGTRRPTGGESHAVGPIVERAVDVFRRDLHEGVEVTVAIEDDVPPIGCDPGAIGLVVSNVLANTRQVLPSVPGPTLIRVEVRCLDGEVCITVEDDGRGYSEEEQRSIFQPFFAARRGRGEGGLGLATADAIVHEHRGTIEVESAEGRGTTMTIRLPVADAMAHDERPRTPVEASHADREHLRVLLVDDEELVRKVVLRTLRDAGHKVFAVDNDEDAKYVLTQHPDVDLLLLDQSTPTGTHSSFVAEVRERCPAARILYFTGHDVSREMAAEVDGVVQKPISRSSLLEAVTRAIDMPPVLADSAE